MYIVQMYMCVNSLNALAHSAKKMREIHFVLFYVYASMIPVLIFSLQYSCCRICVLQFLLYIGTNDCTVNLHPWLQHTLIYVTYIVNVLHDKSDVNFPFENEQKATQRHRTKISLQRIFEVIYEERKLIELELSVDPFV